MSTSEVVGERPEQCVLDVLFAPRRVAVYGASSRNSGALGNVLLRNAVAARPAIDVVAVHPEAEEIDGVPAVRSLSGPVDVALVSVPAHAVPSAVADASTAGCAVAVVLSSGFAEAGAEGARLQEDLRVAAGAIRVIGPNCMGVVSRLGERWFNGSYFWDLPKTPGSIGLISQSGAFGGMFLAESRSRELGLSRFVSIGNAADVDATELLAWLGSDPQTGVVGMFLEAVTDGKRFVELARSITTEKPVVVLKGAKRGSGARAAASHTGALAGAHGVFAAAMRAAGVIEAPDSDAFFDILASLAAQQPAGRRAARPAQVAIVTVSGGPGVLAADAAEEIGLAVPPARRETVARLTSLVPGFAALGNPFDFTPQCPPDVLQAAVRTVLEDPTYDSAVLVDCGLDRPEMADAFASAAASRHLATSAFVLDAPETARVLRARGIPSFQGPERAVRSLGHRPRRPAADGPGVTVAVADGERNGHPDLPKDFLDEWESKELLGATLPRPREERTSSVEEAVAVARQLGGVVVAKACGPAHKSDAGLVRTSLDPTGVAACWDQLAAAGDGSVLVAEEVTGELELFVGGQRDPTFGPVISVGFGGVMAEVLDDVCFLLAPVEPDDLEMGVRTLRGARLLDGFRGSPAVDRATLFRVVRAVSDALTTHQEILEIDCNPVAVRNGCCLVLDALVVR